jgi:hypothetical protein
VYIAPVPTVSELILNLTEIGETRLEHIERFQGQYRGKISKLSDEVAAYIAGFLDGDGSIMAQLVYRKDYRFGYQVRVSIVFYQKRSHSEILFWLKEQLKYGYIRNRNDGMTEYTIVGLREVEQVLTLLHPKLRLKKNLARDVLRLIKLHPKKMTAEKLLTLAILADKTAEFNYSKKRTITASVVQVYLKSNKLFPVETSDQLAAGLGWDAQPEPHKTLAPHLIPVSGGEDIVRAISNDG